MNSSSRIAEVILINDGDDDELFGKGEPALTEVVWSRNGNEIEQAKTVLGLLASPV